MDVRQLCTSVFLPLLMIATAGTARADIVDDITAITELVPKQIYQPMKPSQAPEIYGPSVINAQMGNQGLSVGVRRNGDISTYSWPRPSMHDQVKFHATSRGEENWGAARNAGLQLGFQLKVQTGTRQERDGCARRYWWGGCKEWRYKTVPVYELQPSLLREWTLIEQIHPSDLNDLVVTRYENQALGLQATVTDLVPINEQVSTDRDGDPGTYAGYDSYREALAGDALIRRVNVSYMAGRENDPVKHVRLFSYANFDMVGSHHPYLPTADWAEPLNSMEDAYYDSQDDAIYHLDQDRNNPKRVIAMAFNDVNSGAHDVQVGYDNIACVSLSVDCVADFGIDAIMSFINTLNAIPGVNMGDLHVRGAWGDFQDDAKLAGWMNACPNSFPWNWINWCATLRGYYTSSGMMGDVLLDNGSLSATRDAIFTNAHSKAGAQALLGEVRYQLDFDAAVAAKESWFRHLMAQAPIPVASENIEGLSKRALVTLIQNYDPQSGAIVASIARQSPYAEDWPRDGAYFNYVLDHTLGLHDWVTKRNFWYAELQKKSTDSSLWQPLVPVGNWAMNYYGDGEIGGIIPWEVDETGYMVWAFWNHYEATGDLQYLADIYPALQRAADFLVEFRDPDNNLPKPGHEDDHIDQSQTLVGANTTWLAMKAAEQAANELGHVFDAQRYAWRKQQLDDAINAELWNADKQAWGFKHWGQAELAWPTQFRPWSDPQMQSHLEASWSKIFDTFLQPNGPDNVNSEGRVQGLYETKFLIPMAKSSKATGNSLQMQRVQEGLNWIADKWATPDTGILGEVWMKCGSPSTAWPCDDPNSVHNHEDGIIATVSQPHAWQQVLFYLGAIEAYPTAPLGQ